MLQKELLLDIKQVCAITTLSKATVYRMIQRREFPPAVRVSTRRRAFKASDVFRFIEGRSQ